MKSPRSGATNGKQGQPISSGRAGTVYTPKEEANKAYKFTRPSYGPFRVIEVLGAVHGDCLSSSSPTGGKHPGGPRPCPSFSRPMFSGQSRSLPGN